MRTFGLIREISTVFVTIRKIMVREGTRNIIHPNSYLSNFTTTNVFGFIVSRQIFISTKLKKNFFMVNNKHVNFLKLFRAFINSVTSFIKASYVLQGLCLKEKLRNLSQCFKKINIQAHFLIKDLKDFWQKTIQKKQPSRTPLTI